MLALSDFRSVIPQSAAKLPVPLGWLPKRSRSTELSIQEICGLTVVTLRSDLSALRQRKFVLRAIRHAPASQSCVVIDISALRDKDSSLASLIADAANESARSRLSLALSGASKSGLALLELTGLSKVVRCFPSSGEAMTALFNAVGQAER